MYLPNFSFSSRALGKESTTTQAIIIWFLRLLFFLDLRLETEVLGKCLMFRRSVPNGGNAGSKGVGR